MTAPDSFDTTAAADQAIFILDCDNTLLDNDSLKSDLDTQLGSLLGRQLLEQFWSVYEEVRDFTGTVDFPLTLDRFRFICTMSRRLGSYVISSWNIRLAAACIRSRWLHFTL